MYSGISEDSASASLAREMDSTKYGCQQPIHGRINQRPDCILLKWEIHVRSCGILHNDLWYLAHYIPYSAPHGMTTNDTVFRQRIESG